MPTVFDVAKKEQRAAEITALQDDAAFWKTRELASALTQELAELNRDISHIRDIEKNLTDQKELYEMAQSESDEQTLNDVANTLEQIDTTLKERERLIHFNGPHDTNNAIVTIQSGAGGTDAQDWAEMLERMYLRYAEKRGWKTILLDRMPGEEAGIKHSTFIVQGSHVFGILKSEHGVHRLVRLSPFNAKNLRQTSFARVEILPELKEKEIPAIDPKDLVIDTFRASGAGGQHVNKTSSAVRIHHLPTGIVTQSQSQRSQTQNKATAMSFLAAKLQILIEEQKVQEVKDLRGTHQQAAFGSQIRSYVLHPYTLVKDHRSNVETHNATAVLEGDLDAFVIY